MLDDPRVGEIEDRSAAVNAEAIGKGKAVGIGPAQRQGTYKRGGRLAYRQLVVRLVVALSIVPVNGPEGFRAQGIRGEAAVMDALAFRVDKTHAKKARALLGEYAEGAGTLEEVFRTLIRQKTPLYVVLIEDGGEAG